MSIEILTLQTSLKKKINDSEKENFNLLNTINEQREKIIRMDSDYSIL